MSGGGLVVSGGVWWCLVVSGGVWGMSVRSLGVSEGCLGVQVVFGWCVVVSA